MMRAMPSAAVLLLVVSATARAEVPQAVLDAEAARVETMARVEPTVLAVFSAEGQGGGSGVVISPDGYALSNFHVTAMGPALKCGMADGEVYDAVIVGIDPTGDVAMLKLLGRDDFPHAELGDSDQLRIGDSVFAMGNPFLLATDFRPTVTYGIISGTHRYQYPAGTLLEYADCLQTDASINPGNSGGPLFNDRGQLVGINGRASFEKRGRVNVGVAYAISINQIKNFLGHLRSGRIVDHATLGARVASDIDGRVVVDDLLDTSDAFRRGLRYRDEIVRFADRPIHTVNGFKNVLGILPEGWRVPLVIRRGGERHEMWVRLEGVHHEGELWSKVSGRRPEPPVPDEPEQPQQDEPPPQERRRPPARRPAAASQLPAAVAPYFERRDGYANYYFNQLELDRCIAALGDAGDFRTAAGSWTLSGELAGGGEFRCQLGPQRCWIELPAGEWEWIVSDDLTAALDPPGSGGLLAALWLWRQVLVAAPAGLVEVYYVGRSPLPEHDGLFDVVAATLGGVDVQFYLDPIRSRLVALEWFSGDEEDPCELYFSQYEQIEGRYVPRRIDARYGDAPVGSFHVVEFQIEPEVMP